MTKAKIYYGKDKQSYERCAALTSRGNVQCKNKKKSGNEYCFIHAKACTRPPVGEGGITRTAKSGSDWTEIDLESYKIDVEPANEMTFFRNTVVEDIDLSNIPRGIRESETANGCDFDNDSESYRFLKHMEFAMARVKGEESDVDDFAVMLLNITGYKNGKYFIRTRKDIKLLMCGETRHAKTDVCITNDRGIFLLLQEDKSHMNTQANAEAQLIAEAIAAFQHNNRIRKDDMDKKPEDSRMFPGITMIGTYTTFYKITVTKN